MILVSVALTLAVVFGFIFYAYSVFRHEDARQRKKLYPRFCAICGELFWVSCYCVEEEFVDNPTILGDRDPDLDRESG